MSKFKNLLEKAKALSDDLAHYEDTQLTLNTIEGETDAMEWLDWTYERQMQEKALQDSIDERIRALRNRKSASQNREQSFKGMTEAVYNAIGEDKIKRPEYTVYKQAGRVSVQVTDESLIPDAYMRIKKSPDKKALQSALEGNTNLSGAELVKGDDYIVIRRK